MELDPVDQAAQILENGPLIIQYILMALGSMVVGGFAYIKITPTQDDDKWLQSLEQKPMVGFVLRLLVRLAPVQRKEPATVKVEEPKQ